MASFSRTPTVTSLNDPLTHLIRPPSRESSPDRMTRLHLEQEAKAISDAIDAQLSVERESNRRSKSAGEVKLLLLGQAESGKSTLQKQFQLLYSPKSLDQERLSWKIVVYLNIVRAVKTILEALHIASERALPRTPVSSDRELPALRLRLTPILTMEEPLASELVGGVQLSSKTPKQGFYSRSGWQWASFRTSSGMQSSSNDFSPLAPHDTSKILIPMERILNACKEDIGTLFKHEMVRKLIDQKLLRLQEWSHYFLSNIHRIAQLDYIPSDDDILHSRLQTIGVAEHRFLLNMGNKQVAWYLYDVGGARGQRRIWASYFSNATAIIFLSPLSAFDQNLEEDSSVNRIFDSVELFKSICANKLLENVHMVLFLNKADLLRSKLDAGVQVRRYISSFGDRPNRYDDVVNYFKAHFLQAHKLSHAHRIMYTHVTTMVDTQATKKIITNVRDTLFRGHLKDAALV